MALSRWNHSRWYIYEQENSLCVCGDGNLSIEELTSNFDKTLEQFKMHSTPLDFLILKKYVKDWLLVNQDKISKQEYKQRITKLRNFEYRRCYFNYGNLDMFLQSAGKNINANERLVNIKDRKKSVLNIEQLDLIPITIKSFEKRFPKLDHLNWKTQYSYKNKENKTVVEETDLYLSNLISPEQPLIVGQTYLYHRKENFIINDNDSNMFKNEINSHIDEMISLLQKNKI